MDVNDAQFRSRRRLLLLVGVLASVLILWIFSRPDSEIDATRRHYVELQRQVAAAREGKAVRATDRSRIMRLRAQARAATGAQRETLEAEASTVEAGLAWGNRATVRAAVLAEPLVAFRRPAEAPAVPGAPANVTPQVGANGAPTTASPPAIDPSGCVACHLTVRAPGYEAYPSPFRTHPNLAAYVGSESPHPAAKMTCRQCHEGTETATTFQGAGHSTMDAARHNANAKRVWTDSTSENAMLPVTRTEAACVTCHPGEWFLPNATALNAAYVTYDRAGCYACHSWPGYDRARKRGPDLRRVGAKLSPDWVRTWLRAPRSVKPATWMPDFWQPSDFGADGRGEPEVAAIVAYLFANSEPYSPAARNPPAGDPARGQQLVTSVGCLGCHTTEAGVGRASVGLRRTFGPPLQALRGKVSHAWLYDWVIDPTQFSPSTQMPSLRLSAGEAADVAAYLTTLDGAPVDDSAPVAVPDDAFRRVARLHSQTASEITSRLGDDPDALSGEPLRVETGRRVIAALGCYRCHAIAGFEYQQPIQYPLRLGAPVRDEEISQRLHQSVAGSGREVDARAQSLLRRAPHFTLQPEEASSLALAATALPRARGTAGTTSARGLGRAVMHQRNCVGCHVMEGAGGDYVKLVTDPSLGPPLLTPEGSRVQPDWLRGFLREPKTIRPWLSVRMPTFGLSTGETVQIGAYFRAVATPNPRPAAPAGATAAAGKELFELLKCQQCHVLATIPKDQPTSNLAPDLRLSHERLQPDWILSWLQNPSAILPGTRMPTFWPDYPTSFYAPLDKNGAAQVRAIRDHLLTLH
ncbi:MAG: c-type cytochrome [Vicinamibacterales bacterium]